ncbi:unnamed protein product [Effrenium voratum]|nr:unnamed protein product [Effrenium voratum]
MAPWPPLRALLYAAPCLVLFGAGARIAGLALVGVVGLLELSRAPLLLRLLLSYGLGALLSAHALLAVGRQSPDETAAPLPPAESVNTLSIILPCANESFVRETVLSIWDTTPAEELVEIIIVDDESVPPVAEHLERSGGFLGKHRVRVLRNPKGVGLISSKRMGADAAKGDAVVFLDCHVKPMANWTAPLLEHLRANSRRVVMPEILGLDVDTWQEMPIGTMEGGKKMCLSWSADMFWCNLLPGPEVPILSGGLLAMTRSWWRESGGYDPSMRFWGGENLDQSLRTWLCGGEIVWANGSQVAHMYRDPSKPKTTLRYHLPEEHILRNRLRAATAWMGPWLQKVQGFPEFSNIDVGSMDYFDELKQRLKCGSFVDYIHRFEKLFFNAGMLPETVFHLKDASGLCLTLDLHSGKVYLSDCIEGYEGQRWHYSNAFSREDLECCSGLKIWNANFCLAWYGSHLLTQDCALLGSQFQEFSIQEDGLILAPHLEDKQPDYCLLGAGSLRDVAFLSGRDNSFARLELSEGTLRLVSASGCLVIKGQQLFWGDCSRSVRLEIVADSAGRKQLGTGGMCLDAGQGNTPMLYSCHEPELRMHNQEFLGDHGTALCWAQAPPEEPMCLGEVEEGPSGLELAPCGFSDSQALFARAHGDGTVLVHQDACLLPDLQRQLPGGTFPLVFGPCSMAWQEGHEQLKLLAPDHHQALCLAAEGGFSGSAATAVAAPCDRGSLLQRFELVKLTDERVAVRRMSYWIESGKKRYPGLCLDRAAPKRQMVEAVPCREAMGAWSTLWEEVPLERQLYNVLHPPDHPESAPERVPK